MRNAFIVLLLLVPVYASAQVNAVKITDYLTQLTEDEINLEIINTINHHSCNPARDLSNYEQCRADYERVIAPHVVIDVNDFQSSGRIILDLDKEEGLCPFDLLYYQNNRLRYHFYMWTPFSWPSYSGYLSNRANRKTQRVLNRLKKSNIQLIMTSERIPNVPVLYQQNDSIYVYNVRLNKCFELSSYITQCSNYAKEKATSSRNKERNL